MDQGPSTTDIQLRIRESRGKLFPYFLVVTAIAATMTYFAWIEWRHSTSDMFGRLFPTVLAVLCLVVWAEGLRRLIWPLSLVLDRDGFHLQHWTSRRVRWRDIEEFKLVYSRFDIWSRRTTFHNEPPGRPHVGWTMKPRAETHLTRYAKVVLGSVHETMPGSMTIGAVELAPVMIEWRRRYAPPNDVS